MERQLDIASQTASPLAIAARGWASRGAALVAGGMAFASLTGGWLYLAEFSVFAQLLLLAHVASGLLLIGPAAYYVVRHIATWGGQKLTVTMATGYALAGALAICVVSGLVVTWQSARGPALSAGWDLTHLVSGLLTAALLGVHLPLAYRGRRLQRQIDATWRQSVGLFGRRVLVGVACGVGAACAAAVRAPQSSEQAALPADYQRSEYVERYEEYRGSPFAPSYARTAHGELVQPAALSNSQSCGTAGCHAEILAEWLPSAHRFSAMNPPFQKIQQNFAADRGPAETRYCAGCHDPISLFAGAKDIHHQDLSAPGMQEGVSCAVCHSMVEVDQRGNADYVLAPPRKYLWEGTDGWRKWASDFLIRAYPRQHLHDYDRPVLRSPEFCGACHKQFIPEALNRFGMAASQNQYDEWRMSHWHADDPVDDLSCTDCHMRLVPESCDPSRGEAGMVRRTRDDGAHRHHGTIATNFLMPQVLRLEGWERHVKLTEDWIRGETVLPEIAHLWPSGPVAEVQIVAPADAAPGSEVRLQAVVTNRKAGHNLTTGPLDFMRAWVHLRVTDAEGAVLGEWGGLDAETRRIHDTPGRPHQIGNSREEGTLVLEGMPMDAEREPLLKHELWRMAGGEGKRVIFPGYSDSQTYVLQIPATAVGPLRVEAAFNYRRYRQDFLDETVPELERVSGVRQPTVAHSRDAAQIEIRP